MIGKETKTETGRMIAGRNAGLVGIGVNLLLFAVKLTAGLLSGSVSILADAVNNLTDAGSSVILMVGYWVAAKPADREHPYGHARMEYLCGLFISVIVTVLGIELLRTSLSSVFSAAGEESVSYSALSVVIMIAAILVKILLALYYRRVGQRIQSETLRASAADSIGDVCSTAAVLLGIALTPVIGSKADGIFGAAVALYILVMGVKLVLESSNPLLGTAPDIELVKKLVGKLRSYDGVLGIHDLVIHSYGVDRFFVTAHVEVDAARDVMESHDLIDNIEVDFAEQMGVTLVIHMDPITLDDVRVNELRIHIGEIIERIASEFSSPISFHDFRVVFGVTHTNVIFDMAISGEFPLTNEELVKLVREDAERELGPGYHIVITVDRDYVATRY